MKTLFILSENQGATTLENTEGLTRCCVGIESRVGDCYQPFRDAGDVVFTEGMDPVFFFAKQGLHFNTVIDGRNGDVYVAIDEGLDRFPD